MEEVELKAGLSGDDLARLARRLARGHGPPAVHRLNARYFDTEDARLAKAGMALRIRDEDGVLVQTLKSGRVTVAGFHHVLEDTAVVPSPRLALDRIADPAARAFLAPLALMPRHETRVRRRTWTMDVPGGRVEIGLDRGFIHAGAAREPIAEAEVELLEGSPEAVFDAAAALLAGLPARLDLPSKAARGTALATGAGPERKPPARPSPVLPDTVAAAAFEQQLEALARAVAVHLHATLTADDPEGPHQLRVALRRLRVLFRFFRPILDTGLARSLSATARDIARLVSPTRDADVLLADHFLPQADPPLAAALERHRAHVRAETRGALRRAGATGFAIRLLKHGLLGGWQRQGARARLAARAEDILAPGLDRLWQRVLDRGNRLASLDPEDRHELRKDLKKLRYASDLMKGGPQQKPFLSALRKLQEDLGALNDLAVLADFSPALDEPGADAALAALKQRLLASSRPRADQLLGRACRHWRALAATDPWWQPERAAPQRPALVERNR
jgi:inorganic triphosphatase YgiF